jgi:hypothetical protein
MIDRPALTSNGQPGRHLLPTPLADDVFRGFLPGLPRRDRRRSMRLASCGSADRTVSNSRVLGASAGGMTVHLPARGTVRDLVEHCDLKGTPLHQHLGMDAGELMELPHTPPAGGTSRSSCSNDWGTRARQPRRDTTCANRKSPWRHCRRQSENEKALVFPGGTLTPRLRKKKIS